MNCPKSHHGIRGKRGKFKGKFKKKGSVSRREKLSASIASIAQRKKSSDTTEDFDGSRIKTNIHTVADEKGRQAYVHFLLRRTHAANPE